MYRLPKSRNAFRHGFHDSGVSLANQVQTTRALTSHAVHSVNFWDFPKRINRFEARNHHVRRNVCESAPTRTAGPQFRARPIARARRSALRRCNAARPPEFPFADAARDAKRRG